MKLPLALTVLLAAACSGATNQASSHAMRPLERVRALGIIHDALRTQGLAPQAGRAVHVVGRKVVDCDVHVGATRDCVEYLNDADRTRYGSAIPAHATPDALVVVAGAEGDVGAHVLALDDQDFLYEPDPNRTGPGAPSVGEVEDRLRRVVIDFAVWLRTQPSR